jgi:hypothetical protein
MDKEQRRVAKAQLVAGMQTGQAWQTAAAQAGLQISQSNAYRLWLAVQQRGEMALQDGRHGHPIKLRGEVRSVRAREQALRRFMQASRKRQAAQEGT